MKTKILITLILLCTICAEAQVTSPRLRRLSYDDGLSNNKVNCIIKSKEGFLWIGTNLGLNRYDGFRIRNFFSIPGQQNTLPDNDISQIIEDAEGTLWIKTRAGYSLFDPTTETVDRDIEGWMRQRGMDGIPRCVHSDSHGRLWIATETQQLYRYDFDKRLASQPVSTNAPKSGFVSALTSNGNDAIITYDDGTITCVSGNSMRTVWSERRIHDNSGSKHGFRTFVDKKNVCWVFSDEEAMAYDPDSRTWRDLGINMVKDIAEDKAGNILIATDHNGLLRVNRQGETDMHMLNMPTDTRSLPDNTLQCLYVDDLGVVWIGTYRMGLAFYFVGEQQFGTLHIGDICTMTEDSEGNLWAGSNDMGIGRYDYDSRQFKRVKVDGLRSDIIVSSLTASDGSLWFGTYQGGLVRYANGTFKIYRKAEGALASDNVWALEQLEDGRIAIGTLGAGLQLLDTRTDKFTTLNINNSGLLSNYISSLALDGDGNLMIGHSQSLSLLNVKTGKISDFAYNNAQGDKYVAKPAVNQVCHDSRGLVWVATIVGLNVYDKAAQRMYSVNLQGLHPSIDVCAVAEDQSGTMWATTGDGVKSIRVKREEDGEWKFFVNTYGESYGLQTRLFNKRSILCTHDGRMLVGSISGVNVIIPKQTGPQAASARVLLSGLVLFDHVVGVGEKFNKRVILTKTINENRRIKLRHDENTFTVQLATTSVGMPEQPRFLYRLRGVSDRWMMTVENQPNIQFANIPPGNYTLEVRAVDHDGNPMHDISTLEISVNPPFYLSIWAVALYVLIAIAAGWYGMRRHKRRQEEAERRHEEEKMKEIEEMKLVFFTNISHELRTPLTLILSPLDSIIDRESNPDLTKKLKLIKRNALRLLDLVNQTLDLRRLMNNREQLTLSHGDIVGFVRGLGEQFSQLAEKRVAYTFFSSEKTLAMDFDSDKIGKIVNNLLSNAYKFTPAGGHVDVSLDRQGDRLVMKVTDNGSGISDEDKRHIFERFYQSARGSHTGGSGIGLHLVWEYARMHGGDVSVTDNPGGGTVFIVTLPCKVQEQADKPLQIQADKGQADKPVQEQRESPRLLVTCDLSTKKSEPTILVVDDNNDFLEFITSELSPHYRLATASNGREALERIIENRPDLVLTDVMMPEMDGNELCRRIKQDKDMADLPVVMLTARLSEENEIESRECGADDYVKKPFNLELLKVRIDQLLHRERIDTENKLSPKIAETEITSMDERFVADATAFVEKHISDSDLSVETMSHQLGMSRVKLYRRTVALTGKTPSEFIRLIRLRHAERLLSKSQMSVSEVAYHVGFSSQRYFSKCFKELYGCLPSQYKNKVE